MVKFLHVADLHLDRAFEGLTAITPTVSEKLLTANQRVLKNAVDIALKNAVDFVLIAGDTFHQTRPTLKTQQFFIEEMKRLEQAEIPVFMIFGNHDYYQGDKYWFYFPENMHLFTTEEVQTKQMTTKSGETIAISGFSYQQPTLQTEKTAEFPKRGAADFQIGLYHGGQKGYAPFTAGELAGKNYDYWALGHIHTPQILRKSPWILYPGAPQGHTKKEETAKNVVLVSGKKGQLQLEDQQTAVVFWRNLTLSLKDITSVKELIPKYQELLATLEDFTLLSLQFTDYQQLGSEFEFQVDSGELLALLQSVSGDSCYLWQLAKTTTAAKEKIYLSAEETLLENLLAVYEAPEVFQEALKELAEQPELRGLLTSEFKEAILGGTKTQITADFNFGGAKYED